MNTRYVLLKDKTHPDDQTQPTFEMTPGFKPFTDKTLLLLSVNTNKINIHTHCVIVLH